MFYSEVIISTVIILIAVVFFVKKMMKRMKFMRTINKLPGPPPYPIIGNVLDLLVPRNCLMKVFRGRTDKFGPLYRIWNGPIAEVHLTRPEHLELIMSSTKHIDKSSVYTMLQPWLGTGLLTGNGVKWHSHRKLITPTFHFKILDIFLEVFVEKSGILIEKLNKLPTDKVVDLYPFITHAALDIICETAMGTNMNAQDGTNADYVSAVYEISELTMQRLIRPWFHPNFSFSLSSYGKRYVKCLNILHGFTNKVIQERKITRALKLQDKTSLDDEEQDIGSKKRLAFLDLLLEASEQGSKLTDMEIREEVDTFMFEGHDTTTAGICWSLYLLGSHPEIQEQVAEELDSIFQGSTRGATTRDLNDMKCLERVIKEALRLYPSVPFIGRRVTQDTYIDDYLIPAGSILNLEIFNVHRCKDQWGPDPEKFNPDNFLPEKVKGRHPYAYVPFSAGPRNCIGQKFAILEEKTVLSSLLRNFRVESIEKLEDITLMNELILRPESGLKVKLYPRNQA